MWFSPAAAAVDRELLAAPVPSSVPAGEELEDDLEAACDQYLRSLMLVRLDGQRVPLPAPSPERIARHVRVYGDEGLSEALRAYERAPSGVSGEARRLRDGGASVDEIRATLKLSRRAVTKLLAA